MRRLAGVLAIVAVTGALHLAAPTQADAGTELREPSCSHADVGLGFAKYALDPAKAPGEHVLKVWIGGHRARRVDAHRWVHAHKPYPADHWLHVEILTTRDRWSGWLYCGAEA